MNPPEMSGKEMAERADAIYEANIRSLVEPDQVGKMIAIDVESGDYEVADRSLDASLKLRERRPNAATFVKRIGFLYAYKLGGHSLRLRLEDVCRPVDSV